MTDRSIAVSSIGPPLARSTWSGTPFHLAEVLAARGRLGLAHDADRYAPEPIPRLVRMLARLYYGNSRESSRGLVTRFCRAYGLHRFTRRECITDILHFGTLSLPLRRPDPGTNHFVLCDATWHSWLKYSTDHHRSRPRLQRDAELLERRAYADAAHIFSLSEYVREDLIGHYGVAPGRVTVVGTGRGSVAPFHGEKPLERRQLLFVAKERFVDKGGELLLEAFQMAVARDPGLRLVLVGQESYPELARGRAGVTGHGRVSFETLQQLFDESSVFVMPAHNEPWGLVYLEALASRMPIIGLNRNALPEISGAGEFGFCIETPDPSLLAQTIHHAFGDLGRLRRMGARGQEYCLGRFSWEKTADRILSVVNQFPSSEK